MLDTLVRDGLMVITTERNKRLMKIVLPVSMPVSWAQLAMVVRWLFSLIVLSQVLYLALASSPSILYWAFTPENMAVAVPAESGTCLSTLYVWNHAGKNRAETWARRIIQCALCWVIRFMRGSLAIMSLLLRVTWSFSFLLGGGEEFQMACLLVVYPKCQFSVMRTSRVLKFGWVSNNTVVGVLGCVSFSFGFHVRYSCFYRWWCELWTTEDISIDW